MAMNHGKREAWLIDAPLVYSVEEGDVHFSGGTSESSVFQIKNSLKEILPSVDLSYCEGAVADGQYQNRKFISAFRSEFNWNDPTYEFLMWDAAHFLDLAAKKLNSTQTIKELLRRIGIFHTKLGFGKMHQIIENIGKQRGVKTNSTQGACQTRFIASQVLSMTIIFHYEYGGMKHNGEGESEETFD